MIPKFRAYHKNLKRMEEVLLIDFDNQVVVIKDRYPWNFQDCELMQSTGRKDINGIEIYKGDILNYGSEENCIVKFGEYEYYDWEDHYHCGVGFYTEYKYKNDIMSKPFLHPMDYKIIGNIRQNPELWK